jgi:hypothetical protein
LLTFVAAGTTVYLMIIIFWEMTPCGSYKNGVISQKMIIIIVTAVETSNLTTVYLAVA